MHYVDFFDINGVNTKQSACIELHGRPNAATEGKVGVLGVDVDSTTHDVYKCVAVKGSVHTWELLSSGMSVIFSRHSPGPFEGHSRLYYSDMVLPSLYVVKVGDLVIDDMGLLYQVVALGSDHCEVEYCGVDFHGKSGVYVGNGSPIEGENVWINPDASEEGAILRVREDPNGEWIEIPAIKGDKGDVGKSAYEYAQDVGYDGTEEEFTHDLMGASEKISALDKRTTVLESAILGDLAQEVVDESMVYSKNIPASALPYASLDTIGGHSFKNNLFAVLPGDTYQSEIGYYNFTVDTDGRLVAYFGAEIGGDDLFPKNLIQTSAQYVSLSIRIASGGFTESQYTGEAYIRLTVGDVSKDLQIGEIVTFENVTVDSIGNFVIMGEFSGALEIMVNEGNTVLPWEAYGVLHSTPVTAVESYGANLLNYNEPYIYQNTTMDNGVVKQVGADTNPKIAFKIAAYQDGTQVMAHDNKWKATITDTGIISVPFVKDNLFNRIKFGLNGYKTDTLIGYDISHLTNGKTYYLKVNFTNITQGSVSWRDMGIYSTDDIDYAPYVGVVDTFAIPAEAQALEGYGIGIDATANNYIDFDKKKFVQECKVLRLVGGDTERWSLHSINSVGLSNFRVELKDVHPSVKVICDRYDTDTTLIGAATNEGLLLVAYTCIYFRTFACSTVDEWRAYLSKNPVTVIYQTTEPEVTDISNMISPDNYIKVEGGGTLTFVNEQEHDVPNKVTFVTKEVSV